MHWRTIRSAGTYSPATPTAQCGAHGKILVISRYTAKPLLLLMKRSAAKYADSPSVIVELECDGQITTHIDQLHIDIRHPGVRDDEGIRVPIWTCDIKVEKDFGL